MAEFGKLNKVFKDRDICGKGILPIEDLKKQKQKPWLFQLDSLPWSTEYICQEYQVSNQNLEIKGRGRVFRNQKRVYSYLIFGQRYCGRIVTLTPVDLNDILKFLLGPKVCVKLLCPLKDSKVSRSHSRGGSQVIQQHHFREDWSRETKCLKWGGIKNSKNRGRR